MNIGSSYLKYATHSRASRVDTDDWKKRARLETAAFKWRSPWIWVNSAANEVTRQRRNAKPVLILIKWNMSFHKDLKIWEKSNYFSKISINFMLRNITKMNGCFNWANEYITSFTARKWWQPGKLWAGRGKLSIPMIWRKWSSASKVWLPGPPPFQQPQQRCQEWCTRKRLPDIVQVWPLT